MPWHSSLVWKAGGPGRGCSLRVSALHVLSASVRLISHALCCVVAVLFQVVEVIHPGQAPVARADVEAELAKVRVSF